MTASAGTFSRRKDCSFVIMSAATSCKHKNSYLTSQRYRKVPTSLTSNFPAPVSMSKESSTVFLPSSISVKNRGNTSLEEEFELQIVS